MNDMEGFKSSLDCSESLHIPAVYRPVRNVFQWALFHKDLRTFSIQKIVP